MPGSTTVLVTDVGNWDGYDELNATIERHGGELRFGEFETEADLMEGCDDADVLLACKAPITAAVLEEISHVRNIVRTGVGVDTIDLGAATDHGIPVSNVSGHHAADALGEHAVGLMIAAAREIAYCDAGLRAGDGWGEVQKGRPIRMMSGGTFGVVGLGQIGRAAAERAKGLSMDVIAYDPYLPPDLFEKLGVESVEFEELLNEADCVSVHTPLTAETHRMFGKREFELMDEDAVFVNTARGPIVDEAALVDAVEGGEIFAAATDVFEVEPPSGSPALSCDRIVCSPHHGSATPVTHQRKTEVLQAELERILTGRHPRNVVNPEVFRDGDALLNPEKASWE